MAADLEFRIGAKVADLQADLQAGLAAVQDFGRKAQAELEKASKPRDTRGRFLPAGTQEEVAGLGREFERTGRTAAGAGAKMGGAFDQATKGARAASDQLQSIQTRLVQIASAAALAGLVRGATNTAIAFEGFEIALRTITGSAEQAASELAFVRAESDRLGIGLRGATEQFMQLVAAANGTTLAGEGIRQVFTAVAEAGVVLRLDNEKLSGAFNAIQQIISKGTVSAEELRGQLGERLPGAFQIAARSLGVTTEELQKLLEDGLLPATEFLPRFAAQLRRELGGGVVEASRGARAEIERFNTALTDLQLAFASSGFLESVATAFRDISASLKDPGLRAGLKDFGEFVGTSLRFIVQNADKIALALGTLAAAGAGARVGRFFGPKGGAVGAIAGGALGAFGVNAAIPGRSGDDPDSATIEEARQRLPILQQRLAKLRAELATARVGLRESIQLELEQVNESVITLQSVIDEGARAAAAPAAAGATSKVTPFRPGAKAQTEAERAAAAKRAAAEAKAAADEAERLRQAQLDADEKLLDDAAKRELAIQEAKFEAALLSAEAYYAERSRIELESIERSIAIERSRAQGGGVDAIKALAEIDLLERRRSDIQRRGAEERAAFTRDLDRQLERARIAELEATNRPVEAASLKAEAQYRDLLARLRAEGDTAGIALIERLIGSQVADAGIKALQERISRALGDLRGQESVVAAQADAGLLPQLEAERQLQVLREASLVQLRKYRDELLAIAAAQSAEGGFADPRVAQQITAVDTEIARVTASQRRLQTQIENAGANALSGFFTDLATGAKSFGDAVRDAARNFIQSLARMAAEALAKRVVLSLFGVPAAAGGAGGGSEGGLLSALFRHSGGMVGASGGTTRMVNPLLFVGAPRYHAGGMVGLKPDERPAILQTGEQVLSRQEVAAQNRGGGAQSLRIINSIDPGLVADYMASAEGERVIVNTITRNRGQVKQALG
jgi:tape measure domain-containing protein